tara:strand:+ start:1673 stop:2035 length:363 start_codon:yes stop_codon:yes gene_type:complete
MDVKIRLNKVLLYGYHGVFQEERKLGQPFEIDIEYIVAIKNAVKEGNNKPIVDYQKIYHMTKEIFNSKKYYLIEDLVYDIAKGLCAKFSISKCRVSLRKMSPPIDASIGNIEAEIIYSNV